MPLDQSILGQGVYTPREAARLIGTNAQQVLRWTRGSGAQEPLWNAHYQFLDDAVTEISFLDLIEARVVSAMRRHGVSLQAIRFAIRYAQEKIGVERPLTSRTFKTDGTEILMEAVENDGDFISLSPKRPGQKVFREIVSQSLNDLEYEADRVVRWRPVEHPKVVIDPHRHFGSPILNESGISTKILNAELKQYGSSKVLAKLYEVPETEVKACIRYERSLEVGYGKGTF